MLPATIIGSIVRHALTTFGGALVAKGVIEASMLEPFIGALFTLGGVALSIFNKVRAKK